MLEVEELEVKISLNLSGSSELPNSATTIQWELSRTDFDLIHLRPTSMA